MSTYVETLEGCTCEHEPEEHGHRGCLVWWCPCLGAWEDMVADGKAT